MRIVLPFAVPVACLVGLIAAPVHADMLGVAIFASALTLALAFPAMYSTAPARVGLPSIGGVSWPHVLWRLGLASEAALVTWTFVSLAMLVIVPEDAETWSIHLGVSMIILMMWTPLLLFLKPEARPASTEADEPQPDATDPRQDFVSDERQRIPRRKAASTAQDADDAKALWSFGDDSGDGSNRGDTVPEMNPNREQTQPNEGTSASGASEADDIWTQWPDDEPEQTTAPSHQTPPDQDSEARSLWSFSEDDDAFGRSDEAPDPTHEARVAADVAHTSWEEEEDNDEAMAWDILDTILEEEEETGRSEEESSWEPDEWPDFNYDV